MFILVTSTLASLQRILSSNDNARRAVAAYFAVVVLLDIFGLTKSQG